MSARHGTGHFIAERVTAIALLFLLPWLLVSLALMDGGFDTARAWAAQPLNAIGLALFVVITFYHSRLGLQVIIDDYIGAPGTRGILIGLNTVLNAAAALVGLYALYSISFGG